MPRVKFSADFDYYPLGARGPIIVYRAGNTYDNVKREACRLAVAAGKGEEMQASRPEEPAAPRRRRKPKP